MDPSGDGGLELIERSGRLLMLTKALNLEDLGNKGSLALRDPLYAFVQDFWWLHHHLRERKRLVCIYGIDNLSTLDQSLFRKMKVLTSQLFAHMDAPAAYCTLRSQLCLEENDFFDEVFSWVNHRVKTCTTEEETERLMQVVFRLRNVYDVYLHFI